jgi:hypothetical protein
MVAPSGIAEVSKETTALYWFSSLSSAITTSKKAVAHRGNTDTDFCRGKGQLLGVDRGLPQPHRHTPQVVNEQGSGGLALGVRPHAKDR